MKKLIIILLTCTGLMANAQEIPSSTREQYEDAAATQDNATEDDQVVQQLEYLKNHPVSLNTTSVEILEGLGLITALQLQQLNAYIHFAGPLIDTRELQAVPAFDPATIRRILPYVCIALPGSISAGLHSRLKGEHSILFRLSRSLENKDTTSRFQGDANHILLRYRYQFRDLLYAGITGEKDAGEKFSFGNGKKGFDFYSAHLFFRRLGSVETLAIGDFTVNLGQGLMQWQSFGPGKTADVLLIKRSAPVLQPYRASGEYNFYRGLGLTLKILYWQASLFISRKKISGHIEDDQIASIKTDGYFRSLSEINARNQDRLFSMGANISYSRQHVHVGINGIFHQLDIPLKASDEPYRYFSFAGKRMQAAGFDFGYSWRNLHLFGEAVAGQQLSHAAMAGLLISADRNIDLSFLYRNLSRDYFALFGNAFTENTQPGNEKGWFMGISIHPSPAWIFHAYADLYRFPWLRFRVNTGSAGQDLLMQLDWKFDRRTLLIIRYRQRNRETNSSGNEALHQVEPFRTADLRIHFSRETITHESISVRTEVLRLRKSGKNEEGFLFYMEGSARLASFLQVQLRLQYFETGSYDSRIYAYESDVLYGFSIPAFYGEGLRYYLNLRFRLKKPFTLWMRWAQTVPGAGAGHANGTVKPDKKPEIRFQGMINF